MPEARARKFRSWSDYIEKLLEHLRSPAGLGVSSTLFSKFEVRLPREWLAVMRPSFISWIQSQASAMAGLWVAREQSFAAFLHDILQQLKGALGIGSIEVAGRFVRQNDCADR